MEVYLLTPLDLDRFAHLFPEYLLKELPADSLLLGCVCEETPAAAGLLMAHAQDREIFVDWLYVDEAYRRRGGGRALMEALLESAEASGVVDEIDLSFSQNSEHMTAFLKDCGFMVFFREGDKGFTTRLKHFPKLPVPGETAGEFVPLAEVPDAEIARFSGLLEDSVIPGAAIDAPLDPADYLPQSLVCLENGAIRAMCLFSREGDGLYIPWIYNNCSVPTTFIALVNESMEGLKRTFPPDTILSFASVDISVEEIIEKRIPVLQRTEVYLASYVF